ncbi:MAG TPA: oligopeptidase A [Gammaproteobacteria bacterium]|nr:oligopeptidase A [Gammaproteobacteria bacterium]
MSNPLLSMHHLPAFSQIRPEHVEPAIDTLLAEARQLVEELLAGGGPYTWDNLVQPLEEMDDRIERAWAPVSHMNSVVNSETLRKAYNACLPKLSEYSTEMGQHAGLYAAYKSIREGGEYPRLTEAQKKIIDNALRDFHLSGVDLPADRQQRYREIQQELSRLTTRFEENVLDATHGWDRHVTDEAELAGLPPSTLGMARQNAERKKKKGWLLTLDFPIYYGVMSYADNGELRREMYEAYVTRASDQGPNAGKWDNSRLMNEILALRHELAQLLGFANYAERSLATKMARTTDEVLRFLHDLARRSKPQAEKDVEELKVFAREQHGVETLQAWDYSYYSEKLREHKYAITQEELKPYFPETRVVPGMFEVVQRLYGIEIREVDAVDTWHEDVRFFEIRDSEGNLRGNFYLDLYARENKRGGAWMADCVSRMRKHDGEVQLPVAFLTCNLSPPVGDEPAQFTHDEVITLFHEFGHGLHHMLTQVDYLGVSGINGVAWDAVELPSQFMENWCWEREALDLIAGHFKTGERLPDALFERMTAARNFQSAMQMVRQLEFSLFDFLIHLEYDAGRPDFIQQTLERVREEVAVITPPDYNRFQHSFTHIFAGGYAAGYYSYKWAEVLSADAFSLFEEKGIFDAATGRAFLHRILEQGGAKEPMELFVAFRGREPQIDALLRHSGIAA